jgi:NAD(P)-dependent dehydrogenase (short-subunit alcohol dehydrogenase family)
MGTEAGTAYVTGGSSGIGLAIARALVERGWSLSICGRSPAKLEEAWAALEPGGPTIEGRRRSDGPKEQMVYAEPADVSIEADVRRWIAASRERFGPPDLLVNNAGVGSWAEISALGETDWDRVMNVNLKGAFLCTREVLPMMRARGVGYVINIASLAGKKGMAGGAAYCASKFGMVGFTESLLAEEKRNGIRATAICPGYVATPMVDDADVPASEMIQPADIARTVLYLLELSPNVIIKEIVVERVGA